MGNQLGDIRLRDLQNIELPSFAIAYNKTEAS